MKQMKFKVRNPEHSEEIQKALFAAGYDWGYEPLKGKAQFTRSPWLFAGCYGVGVADDLLVITHGEDCELEFYEDYTEMFVVDGKIVEKESNFKKGDLVRCIDDDDGYNNYLKKGMPYLVDRVDTDSHGTRFVYLSNVGDPAFEGFFEDRFELVEDKPPVIPPKTESEVGVKESNPKDSIGVRKAPLSVVPMNVIAEVGVAMLEGTCKYGRHNYRGVGVRSSVYFDATMRHMVSWWEGEDIDPDSGLSHVTKAITSLVVLRDAMMQNKCTDDRPPRSVPFYASLNEAAGKIIDKHSDKSPKHYTIEDK